jgi:indole-3-glycerol phosphate synthase/phosphoribosylanthranilate isomerase
MLPVGVFRDMPVLAVAETARALNLHAVQLHGHEDPDYVKSLRQQLGEGTEIWTAADASSQVDHDQGGDRLLFDNGGGGTGRTFDWSIIDRHPELHRSIIAGGIGAQNAGAARDLGAYAIDVGSSLDSQPGVKSPDKIAALFEVLRPTSRDGLRACA